MSDLVDRLVGVLEPARVRSGDAIGEDYCHDEALTAQPHRPDALTSSPGGPRPSSTSGRPNTSSSER